MDQNKKVNCVDCFFIPDGYKHFYPNIIMIEDVFLPKNKQDRIYFRLIVSLKGNLYPLYRMNQRCFTYNGYELDPQKDLQCLKGII